MKVPTDYDVIVIMPNSFRQDHISFYNRRKPVFDGMEPCKTPNIDKFAEERMNLIDENPEEAQRLSSLFGQYYRRASVRVVKGVQGRYEVAFGVIE